MLKYNRARCRLSDTLEGKLAHTVSSRRFDPAIDYYAILQIEPTATREEITRSYRRLMRQSHPDRFSDPAEQRAAEERAKDLNAAYAVLSRTELREDYDRAARNSMAAQTMRSRYATPRSTNARRRPTYTQQRSATRQRPATTTTPVQKSSYGKAIRQLLGTFFAITVALILVILLVAVTFAGLQAVI
ncbi:MAG: J domain-containing protein [Thermomicrobiales bacterium]